MGRKKYDLYYTLNSNIPDREFTPAEQAEFDEGVAALPGSTQEAVVLLIYEHFLVENKIDEVTTPVLLPYGGKERKTSVSYDYAALPLALRWILSKFVRIVGRPSRGAADAGA